MTSQPTPPEARIAADANLVTLINVFTVEPSEQQRLVELWQLRHATERTGNG